MIRSRPVGGTATNALRSWRRISAIIPGKFLVSTQDYVSKRMTPEDAVQALQPNVALVVKTNFLDDIDPSKTFTVVAPSYAGQASIPSYAEYEIPARNMVAICDTIEEANDVMAAVKMLHAQTSGDYTALRRRKEELQFVFNGSTSPGVLRSGYYIHSQEVMLRDPSADEQTFPVHRDVVPDEDDSYDDDHNPEEDEEEAEAGPEGDEQPAGEPQEEEAA